MNTLIRLPILTLCVWLGCVHVWGSDSVAGKHLEFSALSIEHGLSQSSVYDVVQDHDGLIWLATEDGLNRYDGVGFNVYKHNPKNLNSLSESHILSLHVGPDGSLWIGTFGGGLNRFESKNDSFTRYLNNPSDPRSLSGDHVADIVTDQQGDLWIATLDSGISCWLRDKDEFVQFSANPNQVGSLKSNLTYCLATDANGDVWIGTLHGLYRLRSELLANAKSGQHLFEPYLHNPDDPDTIPSDSIRAILVDSNHTLWVGTTSGLCRSLETVDATTFGRFKNYTAGNAEEHDLYHHDVQVIFEDSRGNLLVGTDGGGLYIYQSSTDSFVQYDHQPADAESISSNRVWSIAEDHSGLLWLGTFVGGVNRLDLRRLQFNHLYHQPRNPNSLPDNFIKAIAKDGKGRLWLGTGSGVVAISPDYPNTRVGEPIVLFQESHEPNRSDSLSHNYVRCLTVDSDGYIWVGTWGGGLNRRHPNKNQYERFLHDPSDPTSVNHSLIRSLMVDRNGTLWVGTSNGLDRFDAQKRIFLHHIFEPEGSANQDKNRVSSILESRSGTFWLGTDGGLLRFDPVTGTYTSYTHNLHKEGGLSSNLVRPLYEDKDGIIWLGTKGGGLNRLDPVTEKFTHFTEADGLPNNVIYAILPDRLGRFWLSTNKGLTQFDPDTGTCLVFDVRDGLQSNEFNWGASYRGEDGTLYLGGINGLNAFHPERLIFNNNKPLVAFRDFRLGYSQEPLEIPVWTKNRVTIPYAKNAFSAEFVALDYTNPSKNKFRYRLEGFDQNWHDLGNINRINYTNLDPGIYKLEVMGSNNDGLWCDQPAILTIAVVPPWWLTAWAQSLFGFATLGLVMLALLQFIRRRDQKQARLLEDKERELAQERAFAERLEHLDQLKDEFMTNTSHELRTPLNGIIGLVDAALRGSNGELEPGLRSDLFVVLASAKRLANLVNDILDYARIRENTIQIVHRAIDMHGLTNIVISLLRPLIGRKPVALMNLVPTDLPAAWADENRVHQIMYNLVGNAIKFTESGAIKVSAYEDRDRLHIFVHDSGIGIQPSDLNRIFNFYEQLDVEPTARSQGAGLGLAITKKLVELHGSELKVESKQGIGTTFSFDLPVSSERLSSTGDTLAGLTQTEWETVARDISIQARILVVDDEPVNLRVLMRQLGSEGFEVTQAQSGEEALQLLDAGPTYDLVLLDIMMPGHTGIYVCQEIRKRYNAKELPIIMLTAKSMPEDLAEGFEAGANDYVLKPVTADELIPRLKTHLTTAKLHEDLEEAREAAVNFEVEREKAIMATSVLHNIGNVLNSLRISAQQIDRILLRSKVHFLERAGNMMHDHIDDLSTYLTKDPKGKLLPAFIKEASTVLKDEHTHIGRELGSLSKKLDLIRDIIETQQRLARTQEQESRMRLADIVNDALQIQQQFLFRRNVIVETDLDNDAEAFCQELHAVNVLINLTKNAVEAYSGVSDREKTLHISCGYDDKHTPFISVADHGVGLDDVQMRHLFQHGYTTKPGGHGFGLHYSKKAMNAMNGHLTATSKGHNQGAVFTMHFQPVKQPVHVGLSGTDERQLE
ncbi:MAG: response regulator [Acidobacteria bacterium]|nr:response regulator [Acidobacteriota bacterium]